jgi:hypothetical protein
MQALRPLAIQVLYSAVKSAAEMAGDGPGQAGFSPRAHTQLLTTLTLTGEPREVGGRGEGFDSWHPSGLAGSPMTPRWRRRGGRGHVRLTVILLHCYGPLTWQGGRQLAGRVSECRKRKPDPRRLAPH